MVLGTQEEQVRCLNAPLLLYLCYKIFILNKGIKIHLSSLVPYPISSDSSSKPSASDDLTDFSSLSAKIYS